MNDPVRRAVITAVMVQPDDGRMTPAMTSQQQTINFRGIRAQLEQEWNRLTTNPASIEQLARWDVAETRFIDFNELLRATGFGCVEVPGSEMVLRNLVALAASDHLAARVVLQRVLPGLVAAVRFRNRQMSPEVALSELVAAAWIVITTYDSRRNPGSIAAAIIDSSVYRAFKIERNRMSTESLETIERGLTHQESDALIELNELRDVLFEAERLGMSKDDIQLVFSVATGTSTEVLAKQIGITSRAVRYRCQRLFQELAAIAQTV